MKMWWIKKQPYEEFGRGNHLFHCTDAHGSFYDESFHVLEAEPVLQELKAAREALSHLLSDTQHSEHNCGDDRCPVDIARKSLERLDEFLAKVEGK